ncbi:MAG TPA: tandem-95 repeat protein, partial [Nitrospirales bacterium]|nr:tandem-95 repeat protein [Nitrospirales bacterium]
MAPGIDGVNTFGFGATVRIDIGSKIVTRHVESGQGQGNQNDLTMHFGLGNTVGPVDVEVSWPGGVTRTIQSEVNRSIEIHYGSTPNKDFFSVDEDSVLSVDVATGLMNNDFFLPGGPALTTELVDIPPNGQVVLNTDGSFQYTPNHNYFGEDVFTYRLVGDPNATGIGRVTIRVEPTSDSPVAVDDFIVVGENEEFATGVPEETAVSLGAVWKYSDEGVNYGTTWHEPAFDDSLWDVGAGQLGYGDDDEQTVLQFATDKKFATTYFRTEFKVTDVDQLNDLKLRILRDDAAAIYLNGNKVHRDETLPENTAYHFYTGESNSYSETSFSSFEMDVSQLVEGTNLLAVEVHQAAPDSSDMSFDLSLQANSAAVTLLAEGSSWSYLADGSDQGIGWRDTDYDDTDWLTGTAQFGYGDEDEVTLVEFGYSETSKIPTYYFRHAFELSDADRISQLLVNMIRDDGAAVYLNGIEIVRNNLVSGATFNTLATNSVTDLAESALIPFNFFDVPSRMFVDGSNVLAVEVHQHDGISSDISFDLELIVRRNVELGVLSNDSEPDREPMTAELFTPPQHGIVVMTSDGHYSYTPDKGYSGTDSFTYTNTDMIALEQTTLEFGSSWRYLDNGSDQGTAWRQTTFDDSAWPIGAAELGYGDEATVVEYGADAKNKFATTYFRTDFDSQILGQSDFTARLLRDDAAAVYFNGVEVYRDTNLDAQADYDVYATSGLIGDEATPVTFSIPVQLGVIGNNVLAVEVHQALGTSSDLSFDFELQGFGPGTFGSDEGVVNITIEEINDLPVAADDQYTTGLSQTLVVGTAAGVLANDTDDEDDLLTAVVISPPAHGNLSLASDGSFSYTPDDGFEGQDTFLYRALDVESDSNVPTLIAQGSSWPYLDDGSDQGTDWRLPEYDHSSWSIGPAELGFGDGDEQTLISFGGDPQNVHATTYFRYEFNIAVAERFQSFTAWLLRDDGAAIYLNGVEMFRDDGLPDNATYEAFVSQGAGDNATTTFSANTSSLVDGANVIAVEVHQKTSSSSDLSFDFSLIGELKTSQPATVTINVDSASTTPGDVNLDGTVDATDIDDLYDAIDMESRELRFDVDGDGLVALTDMDYLLSSIFNTTQGDTDLDGDVDTGDLTRAIIG